jgi:hypothetical protein
MTLSKLVMLEESIKYYNSLNEEKTTKVKYGRNKLFNTGAVKQIVTDNNFLNSVYNKLKDRGKEIFGYHYNEIILSFIFIKYIKSNKVLFDRYLKIRNYFINKNKKELNTRELEKIKEKEIEAKARAIEVDTAQANKENINEDTDSMSVFGIGGIPSTPVAFAKNIKNWRLFQDPIIKGAKIMKSPLQNDKIEFIAEDYMKDIITPSDIIIENINGLTIEMFLKEFTIDTNIINVNFKFNDTILVIVINTDDLLDMVKSNLYDIELSNKEIINLFKLNPETFIKTLSLYIISEMDEATTASEQEENDLIPYTKNKIEQITNMENINEIFGLSQKEKNLKAYKQELAAITTELEKIKDIKHFSFIYGDDDTGSNSKTGRIPAQLYQIDKKAKEEIPLTYSCLNFNIAKGGYQIYKVEYDKKNSHTNNVFDLYHAFPSVILQGLYHPYNTDEIIPNLIGRCKGVLRDKYNIVENINEEAKHPALVKLDRIHQENSKNFSNEIKQLNKQVSEYMKDNSKLVPFDYDYDKDSLKPEDIVKYNQADPKLQQYIELNKGNGAEDIDFSIPPSQSWLDKLKNDIGEENFKKMKTKAHLRDVERKASRSANVNINDFSKKDKELASLVTVNENITAHYTDIFNKKNIISFNLSTINESTEVKPEWKKLEYQGLGYLYENKGNTSTTDEMSKYDFFFDTNSKQVTYVLKESININKEIKNMKKLISYKSGKTK